MRFSLNWIFKYLLLELFVLVINDDKDWKKVFIEILLVKNSHCSILKWWWLDFTVYRSSRYIVWRVTRSHREFECVRSRSAAQNVWDESHGTSYDFMRCFEAQLSAMSLRILVCVIIRHMLYLSSVDLFIKPLNLLLSHLWMYLLGYVYLVVEFLRSSDLIHTLHS